MAEVNPKYESGYLGSVCAEGCDIEGECVMPDHASVVVYMPDGQPPKAVLVTAAEEGGF